INLNTFPLNALPILTVEQTRQIAQNVAAARGLTFDPNQGLNVVAVGDQLRNPRSFQLGAAFEREVMSGVTMGVTYDHVNTVHLNINRDLNVGVPVIRAGDLSQRPFYNIQGTGAGRPLPNLGFVQIREASGRSNYDALTFRGQMRKKWGQFDAFYTLARNLDNDSTERNATFATYDDSFNLVPEYNYSSSDRRHQFTYNTVLNLPLGFQWASLGRFRSGVPVDVTVSSIIAPTGSGLSNQQFANAVTLTNSTSGDLNLDRGNFADRPYIAPGVSSKRNSFRNRAVYNIDMRLQRDIKWGERYSLSPTLEVFNIFGFKNIQYASTTVLNYGNPGINEETGAVLGPSNPNFLQLRNAAGDLILNNLPGQPRQVQVGLRFKF
ncbi:MAG TPA: hypothetical protein VEX60_13845, partial [Pyrinomonadaceae bacterium]|nr:hypothetical protein [Pyrinomonadaceae bacterium]